MTKKFLDENERKSRRIRNIDINPPIILGNLGMDLIRVNK